MRVVVKNRLVAATLFAALAPPVLADTMELSTNGTRETALGPGANFTGTVMVDSYFGASEHLPQTGALVTFLPGARSACHTHPAGQMLIVASGTGWVQEEGGKKHEIKPGDVIWCPPSVKHWHGATSSAAMSHIALSNVRDGKNVTWMEKVSDEQYNTP
jgi:quercetin dioxygenase-like cupin family protein